LSLHPAAFSGQSEGWAAEHALEGFDRLGDVHPAPGRECAAVGLAGWLAIGALGPLGVAWRPWFSELAGQVLLVEDDVVVLQATAAAEGDAACRADRRTRRTDKNNQPRCRNGF